jgi:tRNA1(Val) A37 N6-methylase TrmN6
MNYYIGVIKKQEVFTIMGGRVKILRGPYNPTSDAVWLAAFVDRHPKKVLDVGTGTGAVALCLMARIPNIDMTVLDNSQVMLDAAQDNFALNNQVAKFVNADITTWKTSETFDLVITNPPYFKGTPAIHNAHHNADLIAWVRRCIARVRPNGTFIIIVDATEMANILAEMNRHHCGGFHILPLFSNKNVAERVLISCRLGHAPRSTLHQGLHMNCNEILRSGLSVSEVTQQKSTKKSQIT